ncbi:hypothetical protein ACFQZE_14000 [Paenibacillus sp. GCM10027627]|uniref:hypothetical protein n=1 Tax=unclassified Paenibacillus TaxID=185978 RepID=UPI0036305102
MKKVVLFMALTMLLSVLLQQGKAAALSCVEPGTIEESYAKYEGVVLAKVTKATISNQNNIMEVKVISSYKGVTEERLTVTENASWGNLNGPGEAGSEYLFFLKSMGEVWENPLCSPSVEKNNATAELAFLKGKEIAVYPVADDQNHTNQGLSPVVVLSITLIVIAALGFAIYSRARKKK